MRTIFSVLSVGKKKFRNLSSMPPKSKETEVLWTDITGRILINAITHPIEYAKVLIQVIFLLSIEYSHANKLIHS